LPASLEPDILDWLNCRIVIYIDGRRFGAHHTIGAAGADRESRKHIPGLEAGFIALMRWKTPPRRATGADIESDAGCLEGGGRKAFGTSGSLSGAR
jgi:hypothetical protein